MFMSRRVMVEWWNRAASLTEVVLPRCVCLPLGLVQGGLSISPRLSSSLSWTPSIEGLDGPPSGCTACAQCSMYVGPSLPCSALGWVQEWPGFVVRAPEPTVACSKGRAVVSTVLSEAGLEPTCSLVVGPVGWMLARLAPCSGGSGLSGCVAASLPPPAGLGVAPAQGSLSSSTATLASWWARTPAVLRFWKRRFRELLNSWIWAL